MERPAPPPPRAAAAPSPLAGLPPELLQHCFSFLDDDSRQAVLDVSRGWHAVLAAAGELVPTARLSCIYDVEDEQEEAAGQMGGVLPCPACSHNACGKLRAATEQLRRLSPRTLRVRLEGFDWSLDGDGNGHNQLPDALQLLPPGLTALELNSYCTAALPTALPGFTRLQCLALTGNARDVEWADPRAVALVPLLRELRLDYCSFEPPACLGGVFAILPTLPDSDAAALASASRLERLHLRVNRWSSNVLELCDALPMLRELSLALQPATEDGLEGSPRGALRRDLPPAVAALHRLTRLTALSLAAGAAEEPGDSWDDWD